MRETDGGNPIVRQAVKELIKWVAGSAAWDAVKEANKEFVEGWNSVACDCNCDD